MKQTLICFVLALTAATQVAATDSEAAFPSPLKSEAQESKVRDVLHAAVAKQPFFDGELAAQILRSSVKVVDGKPVVVDATGAPRLNAEFNPMTPAPPLSECASRKICLSAIPYSIIAAPSRRVSVTRSL